MIDPAQVPTIALVLRERALRQPDRVAFRELRNDLSERDRVTYADLDRRARLLGWRLARRLDPGDRALLLIPHPIDYLTALFGCFYAGIVAVSGAPAHAPSPRSARHAARLRRFRTVVETSGAKAVVGPRELLDWALQALSPETTGLEAFAIDEREGRVRPPAWFPEPSEPEAIAMLQYTSGSTTSPGGVVLRHRNLSSNLAAQTQRLELTAEDVGVSWLPLFHDMGLIGAGLLPVHAGFPCVLMPAAGFLEQPRRWLECLSDVGGTISWAPNFAYKLCLRAIPPERRGGLDLSRWRIALNGSEPLQAETMRRFSMEFADVGFRRGAMYPAYGLAEATIAVSGPIPGRDLHIVRLDKAALAKDQVKLADEDDGEGTELVGCGPPGSGVDVAIVDPQTLSRRPSDRVGEIWVSGPSRSEGYFGAGRGLAQDGRESAGAARLPGEAAAWLRTGDLGFVRDGDLFITGRLKDLIILRGANIYPQDLETCAAASHTALREDCACAIPISADGEEALAIVCEIDRRLETAAVEAATSIRRAIFEQHGLETCAVVIIRVGGLPKTPSGKVQRRACRAALEASELPVVFQDRLAHGAKPRRGGVPPRTPQEVTAWVVARLGCAEPAALIGPRSVLADLGLSSVQITELAGEIEVTFGRRVAAAEIYEFRLVSDIIDRLVEPPA